ncbi:MAG: hypothetical protein ACJ8HI_17510 [Massilia sp.]
MPTKSRVTTIFLLLIAVAIALFAAYTWAALHISYAEGERAGLLQKFSRKGWICKTWEGEILLTSMPGAIPEKFEFSVRDDAVAKQLMEAMGKRVKLGYEQHKGVPTGCFGETEYYVASVTATP